ncbi:hypothetical protein FC82_GL003186 [Secundilactobacillus collinoides DSM 20515 = JCM 1123]|uniref:Uncharacterized protein n=1 Tax=Secundilactobacillus collinoides DSM 20515 = JCM 1123 TaxID=1423733 RepID=A0A0R2BE16_SECCO|nr:hypothetical protein FC82_GL003186 [Secundilactobacillus collinoides DSM 20515 = JCM 1123]
MKLILIIINSEYLSFRRNETWNNESDLFVFHKQTKNWLMVAKKVALANNGFNYLKISYKAVI